MKRGQSMIQIRVCEKLDYYDDILKNLRAYNEQFTKNTSASNTFFVYVYEEDKLIGAIKTVSSWNWVSIKALFYNSKDVLAHLVYTVWNFYKEDVEGIKFFSPSKDRHSDMLSIGCVDKGKVLGTPQTVPHYYYADFLGDTQKLITECYQIVTSETGLKEENKILNQKYHNFNQKHNEVDKNGEFAIVALEDDLFVGGVTCDVYADYIYVDLLIVNESHRNRHIGQNLMLKVEEEARKRNCVQINLGTTQFQAKEFYEKLGYEVVYTRQENPKGYECYTLHKNI
jgi:GNAT superfamily N-acetyltransferase